MVRAWRPMRTAERCHAGNMFGAKVTGPARAAGEGRAPVAFCLTVVSAGDIVSQLVVVAIHTCHACRAVYVLGTMRAGCVRVSDGVALQTASVDRFALDGKYGAMLTVKLRQVVANIRWYRILRIVTVGSVRDIPCIMHA